MSANSQDDLPPSKSCSKCQVAKPLTSYFIKDGRTGRLHAQCKTCYKEHRKTTYAKHYAKYKDHYRKRALLRRNMLKSEFRTKMVDYLRVHPCVICGEPDIRVLEFDHIEPDKKSFNISQAVRLGHSWGEVELEIKKCRVLCANCHKRHTAAQSKWYKDIV